ncbi:MAG: hypothetical protein HUU57_09695 [Bdellovibrio sp.]|nr:hypothetical protein [Bdellovibrio sp.]
MGLQALAEAPKYPVVTEWQGDVWVTGKDGKRQKISKKVVLREKALLETSLAGQVKVQLDGRRSFTLLGAGELALPVISWESGEAPVVLLKIGEIFWQQPLDFKGAFNIAIRSDLFEFLAPPGSYVLKVDPKQASAGVKIYEGQMEFSALNGDESVRVKAGQQASFQGVLEGGEIAYDVLLKGKKIPKGQLSGVTAMDPNDLAKFTEAEKKKAQQAAKEKARGKAALEQAKRAGMICTNPSAKFNECAWICAKNPKGEKKACNFAAGAQCERQRCNANGVWAELTVIDAEKAGSLCGVKPVVGPCDY